VPDRPVLDEAALAGLLRLDFDVVAEVILPYRQESARRLAALDEAVARADGDALRRVAHRLKGESVVLGARQVVALCEELERLGRRGHIAEAQPVLASLHAAFARLETALEAASQRR
jgi:two-component system sensor histidine kinase/response regulator